MLLTIKICLAKLKYPLLHCQEVLTELEQHNSIKNNRKILFHIVFISGLQPGWNTV